LLAVYLRDIIPFRFMINPNTPRHGFLFADHNGPWSTERLTKAMTRETSTKLGFRITTQEFRHIAIAIDRKFIRGVNAEPDDDEDEDDIHDLMAAHSTKLALARYARMGGLTRSITPESIDGFRTIGDKWLRFYRQVFRMPRSGIAEAITPATILSTEAKMEVGLRNLYGASGRWRSAKQKEAVHSVLEGISPLFIIMPTGSGKSISFMHPASLQEAKTTIVITPLVALAEDMLVRCRDANIDCIIYGRAPSRRAKVIIVVTESAVNTNFMQFILDVHLKGELERIVFDEIHKLITDVGFRPKLEQLYKLVLGVQFIYLTATFPPTMIDKFNDQMIIRNPVFIRQVSHKPRVRYDIQILSGDTKKETEKKLVALAKECERSEKILVFCRSRGECDEWARRFGCEVYYSNSSDKKGTLERWESGILFATSALGAGVDIRSISYVVHIGIPYGMVDFEQEVGRGGRDGEVVRSIVLISEIDYARVLSQDLDTLIPDEAAMYEFMITEECRRKVVSRYMNGKESEIDCEKLGGEWCGVCVLRLSGSVTEKRRREEADEMAKQRKRVKVYQEREKAVREMEKERGILKEEVLWWQRELQGKCVVCWLIHDELLSDHETRECKEWRRVIGEPYKGFRGRNLGYQSNTSCYKCGLPGDECYAYENRIGCEDEDVILPTALAAYADIELGLRKMIYEVAERRFNTVEDYCKWMTGGKRSLGRNGSNAFAVFVAIIKERGV